MHRLPLMPVRLMHPLLLLSAVVMLSSIAGSSPTNRHGPGKIGPAAPFIRRHLQYAFTVRNETNQTLEQAAFQTFVPANLESRQQCVRLAASHPFDVLTDATGNRTLYFQFSSLVPYAAKIVTVRADLILYHSPHSSSNAGRDSHLIPEPNIESDHPAIRKLAGTLKGASPAETAHRIFDWVVSHIRVNGYHAGNRGALYALRQRKGDCTELAALFVACCRANGIPARVVAGFVCDGDSFLKAGDYHDWAEFDVGGTWLIADPQKRTFRADPSRYVVMQGAGNEPGSSTVRPLRFRSDHDGLLVAMTP